MWLPFEVAGDFFWTPQECGGASWSLVSEPVLHVTVECFSLQGTWRVDAGLPFFPGGGFAAQFPELVAELMVFVDELFELLPKGGTAAKIPKLMPEW